MPRKTTHPDATGIVLAQDTRHMIDRLKLALTQLAGYDHHITTSWLIARCVHFAYCYSPAFIKLHMPQTVTPNDDASNIDACDLPTTISAEPQEASTQAVGGSGADSMPDVRPDPQATDGSHAANRPVGRKPRS